MKTVKAWALVDKDTKTIHWWGEALALFERREDAREQRASNEKVVRVEIRAVRKKPKYVEGCDDCEREKKKARRSK